MKILLLNQAFHPDVVSTAQHAADLAAALVANGHQVEVLCSRRAYDDPRVKYPRTDCWRGVRIRRLSATGLGKRARWRRAADFGSFLINCVIRLAISSRADVVIGMTSPPLISFLGALFTRLRGGRFVFWVMDLNPDEAIAAGWLRQDSRTAVFLERLLRYGLRRADRVVVLDRYMADRIQAKGVEPDRVTVLPPWSHDHVVQYDPRGRMRFRRQHALEGKFVVMYSGNHSPCHPLMSLMQAAKQLRRLRSDIVFCFIGGGSEFTTVQRFAAENGLDNVVTLPYQPMSGLSASLSSADLHVVVMGDPFVGIVHPCKVYNIRALGIPYLYVGPERSHVSDLVPDYRAAHGEVDRIVAHILDSSGRTGACASNRQPADPMSSHDASVERMVRALGAALVQSRDAHGAAYRGDPSVEMRP